MSKAKTKPGTTPDNDQKPKPWYLDRRYRGMIETIIFVIVAIIFFVINNTRKEPDHGPYPPHYGPDTTVSTNQ
jgi:hypothetical protein